MTYERFFTVSGLARLWNVDDALVERLIDVGLLPARGGRVLEEDADRYLRSRRSAKRVELELRAVHDHGVWKEYLTADDQQYVDVVLYCVEATDGTRDILNEPGDLPRLDETTHPYRVTGRSPFFICARGRGTSGLSFVEVRLEHAPADRRLER